jgi:hypothetical protein
MRFLLALAACGIALSAGASEPVAFVADLKGNATIEGDGKVTFLAELAPGTKLLVASGATVAVTYATSGNEFMLRGPGEFVVAASEVKADKGAQPVRRAVSPLPDSSIVARVSQTATASLRMRSMQASVARSTLHYPVDTRVSSLEPEFRWATGDAQVVLLDASGKELWKGSGKAGTVRPAVKLAPAAAYRWTLMNTTGAVGEARFETLSAENVARVAKARAAAKTFSERVVHAMLLQDLGAGQEAREAWAALARERPEVPELAALSR